MPHYQPVPPTNDPNDTRCMVHYMRPDGSFYNDIGWCDTLDDAVAYVTHLLDRGMYKVQQLDITYMQNGRFASWVYQGHDHLDHPEAG